MNTYTIQFERTVTVESEEPMTPADLLAEAWGMLTDQEGALWNARIDGRLYPLRLHPAGR